MEEIHVEFHAVLNALINEDFQKAFQLWRGTRLARYDAKETTLKVTVINRTKITLIFFFNTFRKLLSSTSYNLELS